MLSARIAESRLGLDGNSLGVVYENLNAGRAVAWTDEKFRTWVTAPKSTLLHRGHYRVSAFRIWSTLSSRVVLFN